MGKTFRAIIITVGTVSPWIIGLLYNQAQNGSIVAFGSYLVVSTFIFLPQKNTIKILCLSAIIFSFYASVGVFTVLGSPLFFVFAILVAATQCISELHNSYLRVPFVLATLGYFLSIEQIPQDGPVFYAIFLALVVYGVHLSPIFVFQKSLYHYKAKKLN